MSWLAKQCMAPRRPAGDRNCASPRPPPRRTAVRQEGRAQQAVADQLAARRAQPLDVAAPARALAAQARDEPLGRVEPPLHDLAAAGAQHA